MDPFLWLRRSSRWWRVRFARSVPQPLLRSRSFRSRVNRRGQHRLKLTVRAVTDAVGNGTRTSWSSRVTRQQTHGGSLPAGTSLEEMSAWGEDGRNTFFLKCRKQCEGGISAVPLAWLSSTAEYRIQGPASGSIYLTTSSSYIIAHPKIVILLQDQKTYFKDAQLIHRGCSVPCPVCHMASGQHPIKHVHCTSAGHYFNDTGFLRCNQQTSIADSASAEGSMFGSSVLFQINLFGYINTWELLRPWQRYSSLGYTSGNSNVVTFNRGQNLVC